MFLILLLLASVVFIVFATTKLNLHAFLALLLAALLFGLGSGMELTALIASIEEGFGGVIGRIGIVIVAGTIIGTFLERSGGASAIAEWVLRRVGAKRVPLAMSLVGYVTSIPVFADSAFVMLSPLNQALTRRAGLSLAVTVMALVMGLMVSHTMVPPTPGPIAAAAIVGADLGLVLLIGLPVTLVVTVLGWYYSEKWARRVVLTPAPAVAETDVEALLRQAPAPAKAFTPIFVPITLIVLKSAADLPSQPFGAGWAAEAIGFVGTPLVALLLGVGLAMTLPKKLEARMLSGSGWIGDAMVGAAVIILITGAGGAFGKVLQNSGIAEPIGQAMLGAGIGLWLPFLITAALRAAQGSATVAIITTASLVGPMAGSLGLDEPVGKALLVLAIGAGAMVASHANDSMFWIVTQMNGMDVKTGFRLQTVLTTALGFSAAAILWLIGLVIL